MQMHAGEMGYLPKKKLKENDLWWLLMLKILTISKLSLVGLLPAYILHQFLALPEILDLLEI